LLQRNQAIEFFAESLDIVDYIRIQKQMFSDLEIKVDFVQSELHLELKATKIYFYQVIKGILSWCITIGHTKDIYCRTFEKST